MLQTDMSAWKGGIDSDKAIDEKVQKFNDAIKTAFQAAC